MKRLIFLILTASLISSSCQPSLPPIPTVTIVDGDNIKTVGKSVNTPAALLISAGLSFSPEDKIIVNGQVISPDNPMPDNATIIQVRHAFPLTLINNGQEQKSQTSAFTVGQALNENGISTNEGDYLNPPSSTPILGPLTIEYRPADEIKIKSGDDSISSLTSAETVGQALAEGGNSLQGLDYSIPDESEALPADGQIKVVRVDESIALVQKSIPFNTEVQLTADLELDQQDLLQVGEPGLAVTRTRIRYEDGQEVDQETDSEALLRPPKDRIIGAGTKIVFHTVDTPDGPLEYYRAVQVYATSYSPCRSGGDRCYSGTSGGLKVQRGVIAVTRNWWRYMNGDPVYIPGYGRAVVSDIGAGLPGRFWIDLAFSDSDYETWGGWTTIYFLTPVPQTVMYILE
jgi:uncharacterized protein YabE (DUF348 family)